MISDDRIFSLSPTVSHQALGEGEGAVVLMIGNGQLYTCNDTTSAFLRALDGQRTFAAAVDRLAEEFEVDRAVLRTDLAGLASQLLEEAIIV